MPLTPAPIQQAIASQGGSITNIWARYFTAILALLDNSQPQQVPSYTVLTMPLASDYEGYLIYVSNEVGGATLAFSDGTNWRRVQDRAIIS